MPIYKPSELWQFLNQLGIHPKKALSQNFLIDGNIIRKIVATANIKPGDLVIEVGPGPGSLTEALLEAGAHVMAIEKDPQLAQALERLKTPSNHLEIFCADILEFPLSDHIEPGKQAKVIANLPYNITTPIIVKLAPQRHLISAMILMVQEEVARRYVAQPKTSDYGSITVFLNYFTRPRYAFGVSPNCFYPVPKVKSAIVILELKPPPDVSSEANFFLMTRTAFEHRRKMLRGSLRDLYSPEAVIHALEAIGYHSQTRPEDLSLDDFVALFRELQREQ